MAIDQQIENLKKIGNFRLLFWIQNGCILLSLLLATLGFLQGNPFFYMGSIFIFLLTLLTAQARLHIRNACKSLVSGRKEKGIIEISIESPLDTDRYYAVIFLEGGSAWRMEFIPQGWRPIIGRFNAELLYISSVEWPVLIITSLGIFYPRRNPVKFENGGPDRD